MKSRVIVSAIIERDGKYLLGQKPPGVGPYPNTWHLIGGGIDLEKETVEEGLRREIKEETGLEVDNITRIAFAEDTTPNKRGEMTHYVFLIHHVVAKSGEVKPNDDIVDAKWFEKKELRNLLLTAPSQKLLRELEWI